MFPIDQHTLFLTLAGSQAHGTARTGSDVDVRGVCSAPLSLRLSLFRTFEQHEGPLPEGLVETVRARIAEHPTAARAFDVKSECAIFDVAKFLRLCAAANPAALEVLFADERDWLFVTPAWRRLHAARHRFLTKRVQQTFFGYAMAQLKKIKSHRAWLLNPPSKKPTREDFGLPRPALSRDEQNRIEESLAGKLRSWGLDDIELASSARIALRERLDAFYRDVLAASSDDLDQRMRAVATHALRIPTEVVAALNAEKRYRAALAQWDSYETWKAERNPARAELERRHGYDTKHAMHLIRLTRMGIEVLEHGELRVRRNDAAELTAIRDGALSYDELIAQTEALRARMEDAARTTSLPDELDAEAVDELLMSLLLPTEPRE